MGEAAQIWLPHPCSDENEPRDQELVANPSVIERSLKPNIMYGIFKLRE